MSYHHRKVRRALLRHGAVFVREGSGHTIEQGPGGKQTSAPRHPSVHRYLVREIVKQLGLDWQAVRKDLP
jgi:predicted RNA binding protein YcfA (HicA-like mRNA interferase family)